MVAFPSETGNLGVISERQRIWTCRSRNARQEKFWPLEIRARFKVRKDRILVYAFKNYLHQVQLLFTSITKSYPVQGQECDFSVPCGSLPTQYILWNSFTVNYWKHYVPSFPQNTRMHVKQENSLQKPPHRFWWKERDVQNQDDFCTNKICTIHKKPKITCKKRFWEDYLENEEHKDTGCISFQKNRDLPWDCIAMEVWILWMLSESEKALGTRATPCILWSVLITWHNTQILVGPFQFLEFKPAFNASTMHREREREF